MSKKFTIEFNAQMSIEQVKNAIAQIQNQFNKLNIGGAMGTKTAGIFGELEKEIEKFQSLSSKKIGTEKSFKPLEESGRRIIQLYGQLESSIKNISGLSKKQIENLFPSSVKNNIEKATNALNEYEKKTKQSSQEIKKLEAESKRLKNTLDNLNNKKNTIQGKSVKDDASATQKTAAALKEYQAAQERVAQKQQEIEKAQKGHKAVVPLREEKAQLEAVANDLKAKYEKLAETRDKIFTQAKKDEALSQLANQIKEAEGNLNKLNATLSNLKTNDQQAFSNLITSLNQIKGINLDPTTATIEQVKIAISGLTESEFSRLFNGLKNVEGNFNSAQGSIKQFENEIDTTREKVSQIDERLNQVNMLKNRITYFFGLTNQIMLFRRAITQAMTAVKELDAAMTEIAVVTDFSVSDMWEKLPEYTRRANELGVAVKDLYNATGLYYQQGLKGNEVMKLGVETMKMARIAGMDAADATKAMTAAIRGFNMEINETSAQRVNDVYSQLAAMTASDTEGIATAMSKTASIAYSANMELETTAALLAQIIETTQESPETAGTAMKTIIARFTEVKKLFSEGQLTGKDEEGEEVNINRIDAALKTVGISLKDFLNGSKGIDDIFLELAQKWDTLDLATQRYIATAAAGSRQQSRFIAMMQDYDRTMELVTAANNSAGASQNQYEKTLESMETLLTKLKNAWQEFLTGIANNEVLKFGVKAITGILNVVNKLTGSLPGLIGSFAKLGLAWGALKVGGSLLTKGLGTLVSNIATGGNNKKTVQMASLISTKNGVEQGTEAGTVKGLKDIGPWIKTKWAQFVGEGVAIGAKKAPIQSLNRTRQQILKDKTIIATNKRMANSRLTLGTPEYEAERKRIQFEEFKRIKKEQQAADIKLKSAFIDKANADQNTLSSNMELESAYKEALGDKVELAAAQTEESTIVVEVNADIMENEAARRELMASLSERSGGKNIRLVGNKNLASTETRILSNTGGTTGGAVKENILNKLGIGKGGTKWGLGSMLNGAIAGALAGGLLGKYLGKTLTRGNLSTDEKVASLSTSLADFSESLSKVQETVDNLGETKKSFEELNKTLKNTRKGSAEYTSALIKNNEQFFEIQKDFDLLSNKAYYELENGVYSITDAGWEAYSNSQVLKMNQLAASKQQAQFALASAKLEEQGANFAEQIDLKTSEITAAEEESIGNWSTATGAVTGGIAGAVTAGATAGSLGGPIGIAIGAILGLIVGGISAAVAGGAAYQSATEGVSIDTVNRAAIEAGKRGMTNYTAYRPGDGYQKYLEETSLLLGISSDQLNDIIQQDASAFAEHATAAQKAAAEMLALAESTASTSADDLGLSGDAREAYIEEYKRLYGDQDMDDLLAEYKKRVQTYFDPTEAEKNRNEKIEYDEIRGNDDEIAQVKRYAEIMGYEWHPEDAENLFGDGIELPTYEEIQDVLAMDDMTRDLERQALSYGQNVGEAFARGLLEGTSEIGDIKLGDIVDVNKALDKEKEDIALVKTFSNDFVKDYWATGSEKEKLKLAKKILGNDDDLDFSELTDEQKSWVSGYQKYLGYTAFSNQSFLGQWKEINSIEELFDIIAQSSGVDINTIEKEFEQYGLDYILANYQKHYQDFLADPNNVDGVISTYDEIQKGLAENLDVQKIDESIRANLNAQLARLGPGIVSSFSSQIDELTINQAQILTEQLKAIPPEQASTIGKLMTEVMEKTGKEFDDILALGLDPQKLYEYATALEQQNAISAEGAAAIRAYARELEALNLGFNSLTLQQARENLSKWQSWQQKVQEAEPGEEIYFTQEEIDEMIAESKGRITASDFRQTAEGYVFIEGLDTLNITIQELINALGSNIDEISKANEQGAAAWKNLGFEDTYKESYGGYVVGDYSDFAKPMPTLPESYEDAISLMNDAAGSKNFDLAAAYEREINLRVQNAEEGSSYYGKSQTDNYQRAIFTEADFQTGANWTAIQREAMKNWIRGNWNKLDPGQKDLFKINGESIVDIDTDELISDDNWGTFQEIIASSFANRFWSAQDQSNLQQSNASSMTPEALLKFIGSSDFAYTALDGTIGDYAQEELDRRFEDIYGFGKDSEEFKRMFKDAYGQSMEEAGDSAEYLSNMLKAHKLAASDSRKAAEKLGKAIADNSDEFKGATSRLKDQEVTLDQLTEGQREAYDVIKAYAEDVFGMEFDRGFIVDNADLFLQLAEGGDVAEKAFYKIGAAAAEARLKAEGVADAGSVVQTVITQLDGLTFGIDGTADFSQIFDTLVAVLKDAEKVKEVLQSLGYEIEFEPSMVVTVPVNSKAMKINSNLGWILGGIADGVATWIKPGTVVGTKTGGSTVFPSGGESGGGGDSSSEWENPYDESYNTLRAINAELRERDRLEREYQHLLDKEGTSWKELLSNSYEFINNRKEEAALQEQLQQERKSQIESLVNENSKYSSYVTVNMNADDFTIDWAAIEGLEGENLSEEEEVFRQGLEDYISALEDKFDSLYDAEEAAAEALDDIRDYIADLQDEYLNAENLIKEAIVSSYQEQIDKLSEINDSINDANSKLLDAVQSSIDQMRQDRENEKTEQELSDKERRLAYLRQDTSGANALEILELEKELEEGRQDYTDSLVDQKISQLQDQNDYAAEQRQQQIDIMTSQLEWFQESGEIFGLVSNLMNGMFDENGKIDQNSVGWRLLESQGKAMSEVEHMKWMEETESILTQALAYLSLKDYNNNNNNNNNVAYNANTDYMAAMANTTSESALAQLEQYRNYKIASQGRSEGMTYDYQDVAESEFNDFLKAFGYTSLSDYITKFLVGQKGYEAYNSNTDYMAKMNAAVEAGDYVAAAVAEIYRNKKIEDLGLDIPKTYAFWKYLPKYKTGGVADFTGPAWLDGTKSRPEMVLNQRDTQNFIQLKDILSGLLGHGSFNSSETNGDVYYNIDINVEKISSDYDIDEVVNKIKQTIYEDASYRNVNAIHLIR